MSLKLNEWTKAVKSGAYGDNCVEHMLTEDGNVNVRHSKHPDGPVLTYTPDEWNAHLDAVRNGECDIPA